MKYVYAFLAALMLVGASAFPFNFNDGDDEAISALDRDIIDFVHLLSLKEVTRVTEDHAHDPELWNALQYLMSDDFHKLVYAAEDLPEFHKYVLYLQAAGYNAIRELRMNHATLGMKDYVPPKQGNHEVMMSLKKGGGVKGYVDDLISILPKKEIQELHAKKIKESPAFAKFSAALLSPKFAQIKSALTSQDTMNALVRDAKEHGIDFEQLNSFRNQLIGFAP